MSKAKIAVCASGEGSTFEGIVQASREGRLAADIVGLIASGKKIGAVERAARLNVPAYVLSTRQFTDRALWDQAMAAQLKNWGVDWVALAGFLSLIGPAVLKAYPGRVVNSHPALLPRFGGPGMFGANVHQAVLRAGEQETGVTIHLIDEHYDRGRVLAQANVRVDASDSVDRLAARVKAEEIVLYPKVLNDLVTGRITIG